MNTAELLTGLDEAQREAVTTEAAPLAILAAAGSGKTRVLTRRIAYRIATGSADADHILALTFTRRAARELTERLAALGIRNRVTAGTFHSVAWAQLQQRWLDTNQRPWNLLDRPTTLLTDLLINTKRATDDERRTAAVLARDVLAVIDWAAARRIGPNDLVSDLARAKRRTPLPPARMAEVYEQYRQAKREQRFLDFTDLLEVWIGVIQRDPDAAAVQHWKFRHLFVDEFQDTNPVQFALLEAWRTARTDLCVVGDVNQSIYGWNGADVELLANIEQTLGACTVVRLDTNYRSSPAIVRTASLALPTAPTEPQPTPRRSRARKEGPTVPNDTPHHRRSTVVQARPDVDVGLPPTVLSFETDIDETTGVVRLLRELIQRGARPERCAVLARTNAQLTPIEQALQNARVAVRRRGADGLHEHPTVRAWLRNAVRSGDSLGAALSDLTLTINDADAVSDDDARVLSVLIAEGAEFVRTYPLGTAAGFAASLAAGRDDIGRSDGVDLATFHAAKGLEWSHVIIIGCEDGWFPMSAPTAAQREEERRLTYVAMSRPTTSLTLTWALTRSDARRVPSPLLEPIEQLADELRQLQSAAPPPSSWRTDRSALAPIDPAARRLGELRAWRESHARVSGLTASAIVSDDQLIRLSAAVFADLHDILGPIKSMRFSNDLRPLLSDHDTTENEPS